jgi:hypothetical protein
VALLASNRVILLQALRHNVEGSDVPSGKGTYQTNIPKMFVLETQSKGEECHLKIASQYRKKQEASHTLTPLKIQGLHKLLRNALTAPELSLFNL